MAKRNNTKKRNKNNKILNMSHELYRQYRSLCPNGKLHIYELASFAFGMACFITSLFLINP